MTVEELTPEAFAPFGQVVAAPVGDPDGRGAGWSWWAETALLPASDRSYAIGYLKLVPTAPEFAWAERHERTVELIVPLDGDCLVYAASPATRPAGFRVFRVRQGRAVLLAPGVWHGAPLAADGPAAAAVVLAQGTGAEDTLRVELPPQRVDVTRR